VQPPLPAAVADFVESGVVRDYHKEEGAKALGGARKLLDAAGLRYSSRVAVGDAAETIAEYALQIGCDEIVMSARGLGRVAGLLLGSTTTKVLSISKVPVTLVR
jgi:nucleotide-binding universal stress UspA family protein